jgi:putative acyl-CoA dehydrogenase
MAACLQGALLVRFAPAEVADAFCATRLDSAYHGTFGTLPPALGQQAMRAITDRATPAAG